MNSDKNPTLDGMFPLPEGTKLRTRKFGVNPAMPLKPICHGGEQANQRLSLRYSDPSLGLTVIVNEDRETGKLNAEVVCTDPGLMGKVAASVALVGHDESRMIRKTVKLDQPDDQTGGCRGSEDFGMLNDAVKRLGSDLGLVVFVLV